MGWVEVDLGEFPDSALVSATGGAEELPSCDAARGSGAASEAGRRARAPPIPHASQKPPGATRR